MRRLTPALFALLVVFGSIWQTVNCESNINCANNTRVDFDINQAPDEQVTLSAWSNRHRESQSPTKLNCEWGISQKTSNGSSNLVFFADNAGGSFQFRVDHQDGTHGYSREEVIGDSSTVPLCNNQAGVNVTAKIDHSVAIQRPVKVVRTGPWRCIKSRMDCNDKHCFAIVDSSAASAGSFKPANFAKLDDLEAFEAQLGRSKCRMFSDFDSVMLERAFYSAGSGLVHVGSSPRSAVAPGLEKRLDESVKAACQVSAGFCQLSLVFSNVSNRFKLSLSTNRTSRGQQPGRVLVQFPLQPKECDKSSRGEVVDTVRASDVSHDYRTVASVKGERPQSGEDSTSSLVRILFGLLGFVGGVAFLLAVIVCLLKLECIRVDYQPVKANSV